MAKPPPASTGGNGWEWWKETQQERSQPAAAAAASSAKWAWWDETQNEQESSETSWSMVPTPQQENDEVAMPDSKKRKPPDGALRTSLEAQPLDGKHPAGMTCNHGPSASTAAA
eukprot:2918130-Amphidinium_carterae.1